MTAANRPTPAEVLDKLAALGSARQIADHLAEQGCAGFTGSANFCPVAKYMSRESGVVVKVGVDAWTDRLTESTWAGGNDVPGPVRDFITWFDMGPFPELVASLPK